MSQASDTLIVGKIGAPYGVKGWVKINSYTEEFDGIFNYAPWILGNAKEYQVDQWRVHNKGLVAKLIGVETRDDAEGIRILRFLLKLHSYLSYPVMSFIGVIWSACRL